MQSNVPLDVQEVDKSSAVVSYTPPETEVHVHVRTYAINILEYSIYTIHAL